MEKYDIWNYNSGDFVDITIKVCNEKTSDEKVRSIHDENTY